MVFTITHTHDQRKQMTGAPIIWLKYVLYVFEKCVKITWRFWNIILPTFLQTRSRGNTEMVSHIPFVSRDVIFNVISSMLAHICIVSVSKEGGLHSVKLRRIFLHDDVIKWQYFRVTGHLCGEFTGHRWIPHSKASDAELWCFLWSAPEWTFE